MVPFAVYWDGSSYRTKALDLGAPHLAQPPANGADAQYRALYAQPVTFAASGGQAITGHLVQDFAVTAPPYRLVAGWFLHLGSLWCTECHRAAPNAQFQLQVAIFGSGAIPYLTPCTLAGLNPFEVSAGRARLLMHVFGDAYSAANAGHPCTPDNLV
jgi:hypothetical protein